MAQLCPAYSWQLAIHACHMQHAQTLNVLLYLPGRLFNFGFMQKFYLHDRMHSSERAGVVSQLSNNSKSPSVLQGL